MTERDTARIIDTLEEGVLQLKRIACVLEVTASNSCVMPLSEACDACGCRLTAAGAKHCPVCGQPVRHDA
jgi:hypothetical protein